MKVIPNQNPPDRASERVEPTLSKTATTTQYEQEVAHAEKNTDYVNVTPDITSKFIFYPYDTLSIKTFDIACLRKIFKGTALQRIEPIVEVISACIDPDKSARLLTTEDFWSLMFWQRINSYKKTKYSVNFTCEDDKHLLQVENGEAEESTLDNLYIVHNIGDLTVKYINEEAVVQHVMYVEKEYGIKLYPMTMQDVIELETLMDKVKDDDKVDTTWIAGYASYINRHHGDKLIERIKFLEQKGLSPDLLTEIDKFIKLIDHGVQEKHTLTCKYCNASKEVELSFDAMTFFPVNQ